MDCGAASTCDELHAQPLRTWTLPFAGAQLQVGTNWCWTAITASLLEQ